MPKIIVKTGTTQDGEFDLDMSRFTGREYAYIKDFAGTRAPDVVSEWFSGDARTLIAVLAVMMQRAGRNPDTDVLLDHDFSCITVDYSDVQPAADDDGPPSQSPSGSEELGENSDGSGTSG